VAVHVYTEAELRSYARTYAQEHGIDPDLFERQINQESGFNVNARSSAGALGIAQLMPGTARGLGVNPLDPLPALNAAARLMAGYLHQYGNWRDALAAYNGGPGVVGHTLPAETRNYIAAILGGRNPSGTGADPGAATTPSSSDASSGAGALGLSGVGAWLLGPLLNPLPKVLLYVALVVGGAILAGVGLKRAVGARSA
jgi:hypothetical protein